MSVESLAQQLEKIAAQVRRYEEKLHAAEFEKPFTVLGASLKKFELLLGSVGRADEPGAREFKERFFSPAAKLLHDESNLKAFAKTVLGKAFSIKKEEAPLKARQRFFDLVVKNNLGRKAAKNFDLLMQEANKPAIDLNDEVLLLRAIRELGSLDDEGLALALTTRFKNEKLLRKLASAAHLKVTAKTPLAGLLKKLVVYARNAYANTTF